MRQNQNPRRSRGRTNNGRNQGGKSAQDNNQQNRRGFSGSNRQIESHGPDGKNRGTANQLFERYTALSREVVASDRTLAEAFSQFADHYYRVVAEAAQDAAPANRDTTQASGEARSAPTDARQDKKGNGDKSDAASQSADAGAPDQGTAPQPAVNGDGKADGEGHSGNSRRRRAQNYRAARSAAENSAPKPAPAEEAESAPAKAPADVPPAPQAVESDGPVVVEVKPRRRLARSAPKVEKAAADEQTPAPAEGSEPVVAEVPKPRRGRPRKVVVTDETMA